MKPQFLGEADRRLFTILHAPVGQAPTACVLLSPPFGQEAVRAHRFLRVMAERLARDGHAVLRFDAYGSGDSQGDDLSLTLAGWTADVLTLSTWLSQRFPSRPQRWFGMGLGATAMLVGLPKAPPDLTRAVLCQPVTEGGRYLEALRERHVQAIESAVALPPQPRPTQAARRDPSTYRDEALGFGIGPTLRAELQTLRVPPLPSRLAALTVGIRDAEEVYGAWPEGLAAAASDEPFNWIVDSADNGTLIPARLMLQVTRLLAGRP